MKVLIAAIPALVVALLTFAAVLPWGTSQWMHFFLPLLPLVAIHYWVIRRPAVMPVWFVFLCGLFLDALSNGPLGFWSFIYLIGYSLASLARDTKVARGVMTRWLEFIVCMSFVALAVWMLSSFYFTRVFDWRPLAACVAVTALVYPLLALMFWPIARIWLPRSVKLLRGMRVDVYSR